MSIFKYYIHITLQISNLQLHKELIMSLGEKMISLPKTRGSKFLKKKIKMKMNNSKITELPSSSQLSGSATLKFPHFHFHLWNN